MKIDKYKNEENQQLNSGNEDSPIQNWICLHGPNTVLKGRGWYRIG